MNGNNSEKMQIWKMESCTKIKNTKIENVIWGC